MQVIYAVDDMEGELKMEPGETCILFTKEEAQMAEYTIYGLIRMVHNKQDKRMLQEAFKTVRVTHSPQEVQ